jgi:CubicO group peptidase (beta-lactamase class C family)
MKWSKYLPALLFCFPCVGNAQPQPNSGSAVSTERFVVRNDMLLPSSNMADAGVVNEMALDKADALVRKAMEAGAFPGCRVLAAHNGKIFYDKSFGNKSYDPESLVNSSTVYDLASLTKIVSTNLAVMRLYEQGKLDLTKTLGDYLPMTIGTDKAPLVIKDLLLHQAGLKSWIPFYRSFFDSTGNLPETAFRKQPQPGFTVEVAQDLWMRRDLQDTVWKQILASPLENAGRYVYSDLDFYFLGAIIEKLSGRPLNRYVNEEFYQPLGLKSIGYQPLKFLSKDRIAPTESDVVFRHQVLQGYVHDPGAALFAGIGGHAGVFGTAYDVAVIFQMLMNAGRYQGKMYLRPETVRYFTAYNSPLSRRGLGFDKPEPSASDAGPVDNRCSGYTFGHQGFTGTCAWADPQSGVVFVFLSNRVYPVAENNMINRLSIRVTVQGAIYEALGIPEDKQRGELKKAQLGR